MMRLVVSSKSERDIMIKLLDYLKNKDLDFYLDFEDPLSFQLEEYLTELCLSDIEIDKNEPVAGILE